MDQLTACWNIIIVQLVTVNVEEQIVLQKYVAVCIITIMRTFSVFVIDKVTLLLIGEILFVATCVLYDRNVVWKMSGWQRIKCSTKQMQILWKN